VGRLVYSTICSLDGFSADRTGQFDWAFPGEEVVAAINDGMARYSTYLLGRRSYEVMEGWETDPSFAAQSPASGDFARLWRAAEKVVYSATLTAPRTTRTRVEPTFDADAVRAVVAQAAGDLTVEGPTLAAAAFRHGLVDEVEMILVPVAVGGGLRALPEDVVIRLDLREERRFDNGMVLLRYDVLGTEPARGV
jgi:dihydrofolate reductase